MNSLRVKYVYLHVSSLFFSFFLPFSTIKAQVLQVFTYSSFVSSWGPGPQLQGLFEQKCACQINFTSQDSSIALLNRLRLEGSKTQADIILGLDHLLMPEAKRLQLIQPHGLDLQSLPFSPDLAWQDDFFIPYDRGIFAFIYDADKITQPVSSFEALIESQASIIYQDPRTSTPGQGLLHWVEYLYPQTSAEIWQQLAQQTVTVTKGWSDAYSLFLQGEADYVLSYTTSPAYHVIEEGTSRYQATEFESGHIAQIEIAAISQFSDQVELAQDFLNFLLTQEAQSILAQHNWMLPVRDDIDLPEVFNSAQRTTIGFSAQKFDQHRREWINNWRNAVSQ